MKSILKPAAMFSILIITFTISALKFPTLTKPLSETSSPTMQDAHPKIQAAILLDVSNSMDGLINQARAQLWNMVSTMGKARCNGKAPEIEIALYEYGRPDDGVKNGYIKQISGFTTDFDQLSKKLFSLVTNGGDEYCVRVIFTSPDQLNRKLLAINIP